MDNEETEAVRSGAIFLTAIVDAIVAGYKAGLSHHDMRLHLELLTSVLEDEETYSPPEPSLET